MSKVSKSSGERNSGISKKIFPFVDAALIKNEYFSREEDFTRNNKLDFSSVVLKALHGFTDFVRYELSAFLPLLNCKPVTGCFLNSPVQDQTIVF